MVTNNSLLHDQASEYALELMDEGYSYEASWKAALDKFGLR